MQPTQPLRHTSARPFVPPSMARVPLGAATSVRRVGRRLSRSSVFIAEALTEEFRRTRLGLADGHRERAHRLHTTARSVCALHGIAVEVTGEVPKGPVALVANHISYIDPLAILSEVPGSAIAKEEVSTWPLLGPTLSSLGVLFFSRGDAYSGARVLRKSLALFEADVSVLAFPEGTTTSGDRVLPMRRGLFGAAIRAGVPIAPVTLRYEDHAAPWVGEQLFLPHYLRTTARPLTRVSMHFHLAIRTEQARIREAAELAHTARSMIQRRLSAPLA